MHVQAAVRLLSASKVSHAQIVACQAGVEDDAEEDSDDDDELLGAGKKKKKKPPPITFQLLQGVVDPLRRVLAAATTLYLEQDDDGPDLVRLALLFFQCCRPLRRIGKMRVCTCTSLTCGSGKDSAAQVQRPEAMHVGVPSDLKKPRARAGEEPMSTEEWNALREERLAKYMQVEIYGKVRRLAPSRPHGLQRVDCTLCRGSTATRPYLCCSVLTAGSDAALMPRPRWPVYCSTGV